MAEGNDNYDLNGGPEVHRVSDVGQANECAMGKILKLILFEILNDCFINYYRHPPIIR